MRRKRFLLMASLLAGLVLVVTAVAQPPGGGVGQPGKGGKSPKGKGGFKDGKGGPKDAKALERVLDEMNLSESKREVAGAVVRGYAADLRRLSDLARADLLLKMKDVLSESEFRRLREAADVVRDGPP